MTTPAITNSSTAAAAADAIRIRLRFCPGGGTAGTGPDCGPCETGGTGGTGGTGQGRLDWLIDAVCANMAGSGGGVAAVAPPGGTAPPLGGPGGPEDPDNGNAPEDPEGLLVGPDGQPNLLFVKVPEGKAVKNRVHLDLMPTDRTRDQEVARLLELGATMVADQRRPDGTGWVVLADPEGNEFCIERSAAERAQM